MTTGARVAKPKHTYFYVHRLYHNVTTTPEECTSIGGNLCALLQIISRPLHSTAQRHSFIQTVSQTLRRQRPNWASRGGDTRDEEETQPHF